MTEGQRDVASCGFALKSLNNRNVESGGDDDD